MHFQQTSTGSAPRPVAAPLQGPGPSPAGAAVVLGARSALGRSVALLSMQRTYIEDVLARFGPKLSRARPMGEARNPLRKYCTRTCVLSSLRNFGLSLCCHLSCLVCELHRVGLSAGARAGSSVALTAVRQWLRVIDGGHSPGLLLSRCTEVFLPFTDRSLLLLALAPFSAFAFCVAGLQRCSLAVVKEARSSLQGKRRTARQGMSSSRVSSKEKRRA